MDGCERSESEPSSGGEEDEDEEDGSEDEAFVLDEHKPVVGRRAAAGRALAKLVEDLADGEGDEERSEEDGMEDES